MGEGGAVHICRVKAFPVDSGTSRPRARVGPLHLIDEKQRVCSGVERLKPVQPIGCPKLLRNSCYATGDVEVDVVGIAGHLVSAVEHDGDVCRWRRKFGGVDKSVATKGEHVAEGSTVTFLQCGN